MARYRESQCRLCRRENTKLFLKGSRCYTDKCAMEKRNYPPGQHGLNRGKISPYGIQLREKQKARRIYGLLEKQFRRYFFLAERKKGITGENLLKLLERRLDSVVYRCGFASSRQEGRQFIRHGHFLINGKKVNIPSYLVKVGDSIKLKESSSLAEKIADNIASGRGRVPAWLEVNADDKTGIIKGFPLREDIQIPVQEQLIVELYSK